MTRDFVSIAFEPGKCKKAPDRRLVCDSFSIETEQTIKIVRVSPSEGEPPLVVGAVVAPVPPQFQRTC